MRISSIGLAHPLTLQCREREGPGGNLSPTAGVLSALNRQALCGQRLGGRASTRDCNRPVRPGRLGGWASGSRPSSPSSAAARLRGRRRNLGRARGASSKAAPAADGRHAVPLGSPHRPLLPFKVSAHLEILQKSGVDARLRERTGTRRLLGRPPWGPQGCRRPRVHGAPSGRASYLRREPPAHHGPTGKARVTARSCPLSRGQGGGLGVQAGPTPSTASSVDIMRPLPRRLEEQDALPWYFITAAI